MSFRRWDVDGWSAAMAAAVVAVLAVAAWQRFGPSRVEPPALGSVPPLLRLRDPASAEPQIWLPPRDRVCWLAFWTAAGRRGPAELAALESAWDRLGDRPRFAMLAVALDAERPEAVRAAMAGARAAVPVALTTLETRRAFGLDGRNQGGPVHLLLGPDGRIIAQARGVDRSTIDRLVVHATQVLDALDPAVRLDRFASLGSRGGPR